MAKVDLKILKKLVAELESTLTVADVLAEKATTGTGADNADHVVELSKAAGLCAGIMQEASMLVLDVHAIVRTSQIPTDQTSSLINALLGSVKGSGGGSQN